jgi:hypothetical protein
LRLGFCARRRHAGERWLDCRFLGFSDVVPMQEAMMEKIQQHVAGAIDSITPEALLRLWMPMSPDQMQQAFAKLFDTFRPKPK